MGKLSKKIKKNKFKNGYDFFSGYTTSNQKIVTNINKPMNTSAYSEVTLEIKIQEEYYEKFFDAIILDGKTFNKKYNIEPDYDYNDDIEFEECEEGFPKFRLSIYSYQDPDGEYVCADLYIEQYNVETDFDMNKEDINEKERTFKDLTYWGIDPNYGTDMKCTIKLLKESKPNN